MKEIDKEKLLAEAVSLYHEADGLVTEIVRQRLYGATDEEAGELDFNKDSFIVGAQQFVSVIIHELSD